MRKCPQLLLALATLAIFHLLNLTCLLLFRCAINFAPDKAGSYHSFRVAVAHLICEIAVVVGTTGFRGGKRTRSLWEISEFYFIFNEWNSSISPNKDAMRCEFVKLVVYLVDLFCGKRDL